MKVFIKLTVIFLLSVCSAVILFCLSLGFIVSQHAQNPEKSDVIIVLGGR